jgi:hypothetical protein
VRHALLLLGLSVALTGSCLSQVAFEGTDRDALTFLTQLHNALEAQNADDYAAVFDSNGSWDGPFGQNALGPLNITTAARQFFTEFGPTDDSFANYSSALTRRCDGRCVPKDKQPTRFSRPLDRKPYCVGFGGTAAGCGSAYNVNPA